jgi:hypothetical protein
MYVNYRNLTTAYLMSFLLIINCVFNLDALLADLQTAVYPSSGATPPPSSLAKHNETFDYNVERSVSHN